MTVSMRAARLPSGGTLTLASGDDGVHSDDALVISGGCIEITTCYEGLEGSTIDLTGGDVRLTASDDGSQRDRRVQR